MGRKVTLAFVLVGLGGCGGGTKSTGPSSGSDTFTEGSRLKARWMQAPGAPRTLVGWYDSQLGVNCNFTTVYYDNSFARPDGGDFYCMPELSSGTGDLFADAACTQPVAGVDCPSSKLAELPGRQPSCDTVDRFFSVGDPLNDATIFMSADGSCTGLSVGDSGRSPSPYKLGAEMPVTSFVHARVRTEAGSARIARRMMTADDGSTQVWGAWDNTRGESVYPPDWAIPATAISPGKWQPARVAANDDTSGIFADAGCTQSVAAFAACGSVPVKSVFEHLSSDCTDAALYFEAGPALTTAQTYQGTPTACHASTAGSVPADIQLVAVGAMIPASSFADVLGVEEGTDRVRLRAAGTNAGAVGGPYAYYFDTQSGDTCVPGQAADDTLRCLPQFTAANLFSDAGCTLPLFSWSPGPAACATAVPSMVNLSDVVSVDPCGATVYRQHVRPVGGAYGGDVYSGGSDGQACDLIPASVRSTLQVYELGAELPAGNFVALTTSTPF